MNTKVKEPTPEEKLQIAQLKMCMFLSNCDSDGLDIQQVIDEAVEMFKQFKYKNKWVRAQFPEHSKEVMVATMTALQVAKNEINEVDGDVREKDWHSGAHIVDEMVSQIDKLIRAKGAVPNEVPA